MKSFVFARVIFAAAMLLLAAAGACVRQQDLPPHMMKWPAPDGVTETEVGHSVEFVYYMKGVYLRHPHTWWWSWDGDPHPWSVNLRLADPETPEDGTFIVDGPLHFILSGYPAGYHELHILLHNEFSGEDVMFTQALYVSPAPVVVEVPSEVVTVKVIHNWQE